MANESLIAIDSPFLFLGRTSLFLVMLRLQSSRCSQGKIRTEIRRQLEMRTVLSFTMPDKLSSGCPFSLSSYPVEGQRLWQSSRFVVFIHPGINKPPEILLKSLLAIARRSQLGDSQTIFVVSTVIGHFIR
jgi:hypothetical protein